jgi:deaminated glutathione amidase
MGPAPAYRALALQVTCHAINRLANRDAARARMRASIERLAQQVRACKAFIGNDLQLVVLPEYFLTGFPMGESLAAWGHKAALEIDGAEYQALGAVCVANSLFLAGNAYELDRHFPGLYFQTSFLIDPAGSVVLRYRRLVSMFSPTPHDVWQRYLDIYGLDGVFPVAKTALGRLAAVASEEILFPEIARALALRGAEVILHSSSEAGSPRLTPKDIAKRARAIENLLFVVSANSAGIVDTDVPAASTDGGSKIVDYLGEVRAEAGIGESMVAHAELDLGALRRYRQTTGMGNLLSRQRLEPFAATYAQSLYPPNTMLGADGTPRVPDRGHFEATQRAVIARLRAAGIIE